jgi:hypothetical protein
MALTFVNVPHNDPFMTWFSHKNNHVLKLRKFNQLMLLTMSLNNQLWQIYFFIKH